MERLTISGLGEDIKREYTKWCVDNVDGNLSTIVLAFIEWIAHTQLPEVTITRILADGAKNADDREEG